MDRGLDPLTTNLVVADQSRTDKTICLAVSPSLKAYGISGRARLFEVVQRVAEVNAERRQRLGRQLTGKSSDDNQLKAHPDWAVDYVVAPPRMARYIEASTRVYNVYLNHIAPEDIHVYSIDEVFIDATPYLKSRHLSARQLAAAIVRDVLLTTGITATAGIGTNLYLAKVAMDIVAKHVPADENGVRMAELDEQSYRRQLWDHRPLTSFWRVGRGIANRLAAYGLDTMGKIARQSLQNEELLYRLFGVNAELLIDHAWGWEPCTIAAIKTYTPASNSFSSGQVLQSAYDTAKARVVACEMADAAALRLVAHQVVTDQVTLTVCYDTESLTNPAIRAAYQGPVTVDRYGRHVPRHVHATANFPQPTSSSKLIVDAVARLYDSIVNPKLLVRRLYLTTNHVIRADAVQSAPAPQQLDLFADNEAVVQRHQQEQERLKKEKRVAEATLAIKRRFGKNAILKGLNYAEGATARERNAQIGGHRA